MTTELQFGVLFALGVWLVVIVLRSKWLVVVTASLMIIQFNWFNRYYELPPYFNRITLGLVGVLGLFLLGRHLGGRKVRLTATMLQPVMYIGIFFVCLTLITNTYNQEDIVLGLFELRYYFAGFVLTYALYTYFGAVLSVRVFKKAIVYIALAQVPVAVLQYISAEGGATRTLDSVTGTFSTYIELVASQILALGLVLTDKFIEKTDTVRLNGYIVVLVLLVPLLLSKSKMATGFVIMIIAFSWLYSGVRQRNLGVMIRHFYTSGTLLVVVSVLFYSFFWQRFDYEKYLEPEFVYDYFTTEPVVDYGEIEWMKARNLGRLSAITESMSQTFSHPMTAMIGHGAGSVSVSMALGRAGRFYQAPGFGPLAGIDRNQYSKTIMEFGLAGLAGFVWFFVMLHRRIKVMRLNTEAGTSLTMIIVCLLPLSFYGLSLGGFYMSLTLGLFVASLQSEVDRRRRHIRPVQWAVRQPQSSQVEASHRI